jgi:hypothetical protein
MVRNEHGQYDEEGDIEHELRGEDRRKQPVAKDESHTVANLFERLARLAHDLNGRRNLRQQARGEQRQTCRQSEGSPGSRPADQEPADRRPCRQGRGACQLDSGIGG